MTNQEVIKHLLSEWFGYMACNNAEDLDFYDFLLCRGFNRWQLSALGIGRNNAVEWAMSRDVGVD